MAVNPEDDRKLIEKYMKEKKYGFTSATPTPGARGFMREYKEGSFPVTYVIGRDGRIVDGIDGVDHERLDAAVEKALKGEGR